MPASDDRLPPRLEIPAPPPSPAGEAIYYSWTAFFKQLINKEYSAIVIHSYRSKGGFTQAINRFRSDQKNPAHHRELAKRIGIMLVCNNDGSPKYWELRFQKEENEQRNSMSNPAHVAWRVRFLDTLIAKGEVVLAASIDADAVQWWLYNKIYNKLARTPKGSDTHKTLRNALHKNLLRETDHWHVVVQPDDSLVLRVSKELREALRIAHE